MFKNTFSRIAAIILSLALMLTLTPSNVLAYADEEVSEDRLQSIGITNINQVPVFNSMRVNSSNKQAGTRSDNGSPGGYLVGSDYITTEGSFKFLYPIILDDGQVLHVQVDMPNSPNIDYDVGLYLVDGDGTLIPADTSNFTTYINGSSGTVPEAVGIHNNAGVTQNYAAFVFSRVGASSTLPFTMHIGIDFNTETEEADENLLYSRQVSVIGGSSVINNRAMNTKCDNDWYYFDVVNSSNFDSITITLDSASVAAGYNLEAFRVVGTSIQKLPLTNGKLDVSPVTRYYVRVSSAGCTSFVGSDYTLAFSPAFYVDSIEITDVGDGDSATYDGHNRKRVDGGSTVKVTGIARCNGVNARNAQVTIVIDNDSWDAPNMRFRRATTTTDNYGRFTVYIPIADGVGSNSTLVGDATTFRHYWDYGYVYGEDRLGNEITIPKEVFYIFAYRVYVG